MIIPGLVSVTFRDKKPEEIIELCVNNHLKAVEWGENAHVMPGDPAGAAALREKTLAAGLEVAAYGSYYRLCTGMDFVPTLVSAKALGAPVIRVWAGNIPSAEADETYRANAAREAAEIAGMVGYDSANYFTRAFKKHTGMTPTEFRRSQIGKKGV